MQEAQRKACFEKRAAELSQQLEVTEVITARISKRRFKWVLLTFADEETEREYLDWVYIQGLSLIRVTRVSFFSVIYLLRNSSLDPPTTIPGYQPRRFPSACF